MEYNINYAVACATGKRRFINQDNFWCAGKYLASVNEGLEEIESGEISFENNPVFAVFDGMGGEQYGEVAAYIAADTLNRICKGLKPHETKGFLLNSCKQMNDNITTFAKQKSAKCVGTTAAMIMFGKKDIAVCNIGDSKIYRYDNKNLIQISKDHILDIFRDRKPPLTQFLGIPENEFIIEPHIIREPYEKGDYYLICSDGLTDMLSEDEIKDFISQMKDVKLCVEILLKNALSRGGRDNITIILCKIE